MSKLKLPVMGATAGVMALTLAACGSSSSGTTAGSGHADTASGSMPTVTLQMKWLPQGQFGGYIAAVEQGFYKDQGLNVKLINGSPEITAEDTVAEGTTDYSVAWPADALAAGEKINKIVDVAQFYQRPGLQEYALKSSGITSVKDFAGKKIGVNGAGNDVDVLAALSKAGMSPSKVTLVQQNGNVMGLLTGDLDAAQGASYNELGQLLMAKNPKTGKDYTLSDLNIFDWGKLGTGMLEDGLWANQSKLKSSALYRKETQEIVTGSMEGWIYCRDNPTGCLKDVTKYGSQLSEGLQNYQINMVNRLIWPSAQGVGMVNPTTWKNTINIALKTKETDGSPLLPSKPTWDAYDMTYVKHGLKTLQAQGLDVTGASYKPVSVTP